MQKFRYLSSLLILSLMLLEGCASSPTSPTAVIPTTSPSSTSVPSIDGLSLSVSINPITIVPGDVINISASERNTTNKTVSVPANQNLLFSSMFQALNAGGGGGVMPFGFAIYQGDFSLQNLPPTSLPYKEPIYHNGPALKVNSYGFDPSSGLAYVPELRTKFEVTSSTSLIGYTGDVAIPWVAFSPGTYTLVVGDEWGALAILHFFVIAS